MALFITVLKSLVLAVDKLDQYEVVLIIHINSIEQKIEDFERQIKRVWGESVKFSHSKKNLGFGKGHNQAIKASECDYHLILNPDVILDNDALVYALDYLQSHNESVLVSPYACDEEGARQYLCKSNPTVFDLFLRGFAPAWCRRLFSRRLANYELKGQTEGAELVSVPIVSGCFMLLRRESFHAVGGFSENFFLYFEDFDLSIKLRHLGNLSYVPRVKIIHYGGHAAKKGSWHILLFVQSMCLFFTKHGWRWY